VTDFKSAQTYPGPGHDLDETIRSALNTWANEDGVQARWGRSEHRDAFEIVIRAGRPAQYTVVNIDAEAFMATRHRPYDLLNFLRREYENGLRVIKEHMRNQANEGILASRNYGYSIDDMQWAVVRTQKKTPSPALPPEWGEEAP
jgi:hypothetical protein